MDSESSFLWQGPTWFLGCMPPVPTGGLPGLGADVDLLTAFAADEDISFPLPSSVLVDPEQIPADVRDKFLVWLANQLLALPSDVPVIYFSEGDCLVPDKPKSSAILNRSISETALFERICDLQRVLIRSEEARLRRLVFGRVPGYGAAPHISGRGGLLVIGFGGRFLDVMQARQKNVDVIGAFDQRMGEEYLSQRAFDAVILDGAFDDVLENLRCLRRDARFASIPVLAVTSFESDLPIFYDAGANDVLLAPLSQDMLRQRLAAAIRLGKRRRLADRVLAESRKWLMQQQQSGGLKRRDYDSYLQQAAKALSARGLMIWQISLLPDVPPSGDFTGMIAPDLCGTVLSIADATSREEDLVCFVRDLGPVAVLKSERGCERLKSRISAILGHTRL
ncbi:response regulator [Roseibium suaedae]|uniref:Response regulator n=1 Tax=Roseibium suaedae TaxID=735517 RepID=A0A1M7KET4_9HYPH|nr:hypothetical protein [Roseibium suaedae]SHM63781.1 hypothetical protein SAMN05444272_2813 [Roseibium suaedae]